MFKPYFSYDDVRKLLYSVSHSFYSERDSLLILFGSVLGLTRQEICGIAISEIMNPDGSWRLEWTLNSAYAYKGIERTVNVPAQLLIYLDQYMEWLKQMDLDDVTLPNYQGFKPGFIFLRNDNKVPFNLIPRKHERAKGKVSYQTRSLDEKLERILSKSHLAGSTPSGFREGFIINAYKEGVPINSIVEMTGFKSRTAIKKKIEKYGLTASNYQGYIMENVIANVAQ